MRVEFRFSKRAVLDLESIRSWLSHEVSPEIAAEQLQRIAEALGRLRDFPEIGPIQAGTLRRKHVPNSPYLIFYRFSPGEIVVVRVRHHREDWR